MKNLKCKVVGNNEIRMNNPQAADPFNKYAKKMKEINNIHHSKKTDADRELLENISIESKIYFNDDLGVWIPTTWVMAGLSAVSFEQIKLAKKKMRGAVFINDTKAKLSYSGMKKVKEIGDLVLDTEFRSVEFHKIGMAKIAKGVPTFNNWSFDIDIDFDEEIITTSEMEIIVRLMVTRYGFGDFRPTYGRGKVENLEITDCEI